MRYQRYTKNVDDNFNQWIKLLSCMKTVAEEVSGRRKHVKNQPWITIEILSRMNERSKTETTKQQNNKREEYKKVCRDIQRQCRLAQENYYNQIRKELEDLDRKQNPKLFTRIKYLQPKKPYARAGLQSKEGKALFTTQEVLDMCI